MTSRTQDPVAIQRDYYTKTADQYDDMHGAEGVSRKELLDVMCALLRVVETDTILDVGCGTGRGMQELSGRMPSLTAFGIEPVRALIEQGVEKARIARGITLQGFGDKLPFADSSVDVVCAFAILHHIREPNDVIREMMRVAKKAVLIVDSNRFGQGSWPLRLFKLAMYKLGLWGMVNFLKTGGKGYLITQGDGLAYSYSVYDSLDCLARGASRLMLLPGEDGYANSWLHPLLTSQSIIAFAIKGAD
jgi:ubiquinone/menaquinone biosynthesis C-methylase UbiE